MPLRRWIVVAAIGFGLMAAGSWLAHRALHPRWLAEMSGPIAADSPLGRQLYAAYQAERAGDHQRAIALYSDELDHRNLDWALRGMLLEYRAKDFEHMRQYDKAEADWTARLMVEPIIASHYADRGYFHLRRGSYDKALADFAAGASRDRKKAIYWLGEGEVFTERGAHQAAIERYTAAVQSDPAMIKAYLARASAYNYVAMYTEALADYDKAIALQDATPDTKRMKPREVGMGYLGRGYASLHLGDHRRAIEDFDKVLAIVPNAANALHWRGSAREQMGDREGALGDYRAALAIAPKDEAIAGRIKALEGH